MQAAGNLTIARVQYPVDEIIIHSGDQPGSFWREQKAPAVAVAPLYLRNDFYIQGSFVSCQHETDGRAVAKADAAVNDRSASLCKIFFRSSTRTRCG